MSVMELARIKVKAGGEASFEADIAKAVPLFRSARNCFGMKLDR